MKYLHKPRLALQSSHRRSATFHTLTETSAIHGVMNRAVGLRSSFRECLLCANGPLWKERRMVFTVAATSVAPTTRIMRYSCYRWQPRATRRPGPARRLRSDPPSAREEMSWNWDWLETLSNCSLVWTLLVLLIKCVWGGDLTWISDCWSGTRWENLPGFFFLTGMQLTGPQWSSWELFLCRSGAEIINDKKPERTRDRSDMSMFSEPVHVWDADSCLLEKY